MKKKKLPLVDNCCLIADSSKSHTVCLVCPNLKKLREDLKEAENVDYSAASLSEVIQAAEKNEKFMSQIAKQFVDHCLLQSVDRFEAPTKIKFVKEAWIPDSGLVTDSLKIKRKEIDKFYKNEISKLYQA